MAGFSAGFSAGISAGASVSASAGINAGFSLNLLSSDTNLKIICYDSPSGGSPSKSKGEYVVDFNPKDFNIINQINYQSQSVKGSAGGDPTFLNIPPIQFTIDFTIDGTGVTKAKIPASGQKDYVKKNIEKLKEVTGSEINGSIHRTNYLAVLWGNIHIDCVLTTLNITYNLFDREGSPLRAKVRCSFTERLPAGQAERATRRTSADLTKYWYVKEEDILPLISRDHYDDSTYYLQIAKVNKLKNFRNIPPGMKLILPPIKNSDE